MEVLVAWKETCRMEERKRFVDEWEEQMTIEGKANMSVLCRTFEVSRQTGYKWLRRYLESGRDQRVLADQSRRPHYSPDATTRRVVQVIVDARRMYPRWGAQKLRDWFVRRTAWLSKIGISKKELPSRSTI